MIAVSESRPRLHRPKRRTRDGIVMVYRLNRFSILLSDTQFLSGGLRLKPILLSNYIFLIVFLVCCGLFSSFKKSVRLAPGNRHVQALQRPQEPAHVQQHSGVSG